MDRKKPVDIHIGQRLKEYRQHRGMTVRELADAAHVTPGQISRYEHGRDRISHEPSGGPRFLNGTQNPGKKDLGFAAASA